MVFDLLEESAMTTAKRKAPVRKASVEVQAPAPAVKPIVHVGNTWEGQATRLDTIGVGCPDAPLFQRGHSSLLVRCVDRSRTYLLLNLIWRLTGGRMENARIGPDCVTYALFKR